MLAKMSVRALMSMSGISVRFMSSWKSSGFSSWLKSTDPLSKSNAPLRSKFSLLVSNWKALLSWSVSMLNREAISKAEASSVPKGSPFITLMEGLAS